MMTYILSLMSLVVMGIMSVRISLLAMMMAPLITYRMIMAIKA